MMTKTYKQYKTANGHTGWWWAQGVADRIKGLGFAAEAIRGPIATDPDQMIEDRNDAYEAVAHVVSTAEGFAAREAAIRLKRSAK